MKKTLYILVFLLAGCNNEHELTMERGIQYYEWDMIEESILEFKNVTHALGAHSKQLDYSKIKLQAEKKITKFKNEYLRVNILRIPEINTKQNLSLIDKKLINFRNLLNQNEDILEKVFFK